MKDYYIWYQLMWMKVDAISAIMSPFSEAKNHANPPKVMEYIKANLPYNTMALILIKLTID